MRVRGSAVAACTHAKRALVKLAHGLIQFGCIIRSRFVNHSPLIRSGLAVKSHTEAL